MRQLEIAKGWHSVMDEGQQKQVMGWLISEAERLHGGIENVVLNFDMTAPEVPLRLLKNLLKEESNLVIK